MSERRVFKDYPGHDKCFSVIEDGEDGQKTIGTFYELNEAIFCAAAPDMLKALEALDQLWREMGFKRENATHTWNLVSYAISKARRKT